MTNAQRSYQYHAYSRQVVLAREQAIRMYRLYTDACAAGKAAWNDTLARQCTFAQSYYYREYKKAVHQHKMFLADMLEVRLKRG